MFNYKNSLTLLYNTDMKKASVFSKKASDFSKNCQPFFRGTNGASLPCSCTAEIKNPA